MNEGKEVYDIFKIKKKVAKKRINDDELGPENADKVPEEVEISTTGDNSTSPPACSFSEISNFVR